MIVKIHIKIKKGIKNKSQPAKSQAQSQPAKSQAPRQAPDGELYVLANNKAEFICKVDYPTDILHTDKVVDIATKYLESINEPTIAMRLRQKSESDTMEISFGL